MIQQGNHPDVIVVTPDPKRKSRTISVDQARELIRQVRLHRYSARWRTVIIDPVDGLMPQAANALLKTFEEPPPGTGFLLVTSRVSGLLPTVRSRSQRVRFRAVPEAQLVPWLAHRGVSSPERVARLAMGCPGRALQLAAGGLQKTDAVRDRLVDALAGGSPAIFEYAENLTRKGETREELDMALDALEGLLRDAAVWAGGRHDASLNADRPDLVQAWGRALWPGGFERLQRVLDEARVRASLNVNGRLILESMLAQVVQELGPARRPPRPS